MPYDELILSIDKLFTEYERDIEKTIIQQEANAEKRLVYTIEVMEGYLKIKNKLISDLYKIRLDYDGAKNYLDENLPGWDNDLSQKSLKNVEEIVERANQRVSNGKNLLPRAIHKNKRITIELEQEYRDAITIQNLKKGLKGQGTVICSNEVKNYLDINLPGWREDSEISDSYSISSETSQKSNNKLIIEDSDDEEEEYVIQPKSKKSMKLANPSQSIKKETSESDLYLSSFGLLGVETGKFTSIFLFELTRCSSLRFFFG
jgi:hypothetical protein